MEWVVSIFCDDILEYFVGIDCFVKFSDKV